MPLNKQIKKAMVIGSGPIVIGQAAEFDYAGTQACRALKEDGIEIVLVNSNPATIMTDNAMADHIYIEPLTLDTVKRIIAKERPDSILSSLGGQTGLTLSMQLAREGFLDEYGVRLLGAAVDTIDRAEDRQMFKDMLDKIGQPYVPSLVVTDIDAALSFAAEIGYPVIVRPAFTLGGTGGGIAHDVQELEEIARTGISLSPIGQILVERCISGWKEIEFEVMRDSKGNVITICSMENFDPVGVHTGDSIVIAPAVTLADREYQMLRTAALDIVTELGVEGGCNCQFALDPDSFEYAVIEVNPRVSRSSALASKATGYPIAKVATKIAIGYTLDEIPNAVTGKTVAAFEPTIDYVAVKFPKWPFDKFVYAKRELGTQMKATGEIMSIADSFEMAIMKAVRGAEVSVDTLNMPHFADWTKEELCDRMDPATDERIFMIFAALKKGATVEEIHGLTRIDEWFLNGLRHLVEYEELISCGQLTEELYLLGKSYGYLDTSLERLSGQPIPYKAVPTYKMVDTCGGEFSAETPYFYGTFDTLASGGENEACSFIGQKGKRSVIVIGSGPIRIGQGIEFDYSSVHCARSLRNLGYEVVIINNNPETVSTDFDTSDRLYFEPLTLEDVLHIIDLENPVGVVVAFGGQTAIRLATRLADHGVRIIGSPADSIDAAEDRERFDALLEKLQINRPKGYTVFSTEEALTAANNLAYPVLMRPSYVLGGQNMIIAFSDEDIKEYMKIILEHNPDNSVLIDKYISGIEIEVDAICDGEDILIPGIMEHIERTGIHSGDSIAVYPAQKIDDELSDRIVEATRKLCLALNVLGLMNLQYIIMDNQIYVIEVNPRASRTVPYISKVTGVPICDLATRVGFGEKLRDLGYGVGLYPPSAYVAVKAPVFSFEKLTDVDTHLGPEMKSTGEVLGIGRSFQEALYKGLIAAGYKMHHSGGVFITVRDSDKAEIGPLAKKFANLGFSIYATQGTAEVLRRQGLSVMVVNKIHEHVNNAMELLSSGKLKYVISTSAKGRNPALDSVKIRRKASLLGIPCLTSIDTANALADSLRSRYNEHNTELVDINALRKCRQRIPFVKMHGAGNDSICIDCRNIEVNSPESLAVYLLDRHYGVGGEGLVFIYNSTVADAAIRLFNLDGSEGMMGGNAIRLVAKYLYDTGAVLKKEMTIETVSGVKTLSISTRHGLAHRVSVDMGVPKLSADLVPVKVNSNRVINIPATIGGKEYLINCVSMGNPHCVVFCDEPDALDLEQLGPVFEHDPLFPQRVNAGFAKIIDDHTLKLRVWERGSGVTLACGTGACAAVVAAVENGYCPYDTDIRVMLPGGDITVHYNDQGVRLTGIVESVFEGIVEV